MQKKLRKLTAAVLSLTMAMSIAPTQFTLAEVLDIQTIGTYTAEPAAGHLVNETEQVEFDAAEHQIEYKEDIPYMKKRMFISDLAEGKNEAFEKLSEYYNKHIQDDGRELSEKVTDYVEEALLTLSFEGKTDNEKDSIYRLMLLVMESEDITDENKDKIKELLENGYTVYEAVLAYIRYAEYSSFSEETETAETEGEVEETAESKTEDEATQTVEAEKVETEVSVKTETGKLGVEKATVSDIASAEIKEVDKATDDATVSDSSSDYAYVNELSAYATSAVVTETASYSTRSTTTIDKELYKVELYGNNALKTKYGDISISDKSGNVSYSRREVSLPGKNGLDLNLTVQYDMSDAVGIYHIEEEESVDDSVHVYFATTAAPRSSLGTGWSFCLTHITENYKQLVLEDGRAFRISSSNDTVRYNDFENSGIAFSGNTVTYLDGTVDTLTNGIITQREDKYGNKIYYEYETVPATKYYKEERRLIKMYDDAGRTININYYDGYTEIERPDGTKVRYIKDDINVTYNKGWAYSDAPDSIPVVTQIKDMSTSQVIGNFDYGYEDILIWRGRAGPGLYGWDYNIIATLTSYDDGNGGKEKYEYAVNTVANNTSTLYSTQGVALTKWKRNNDVIMQKSYQYNALANDTFTDTVTTITNGNNVSVDVYEKEIKDISRCIGELQKITKSVYSRSGSVDTLKQTTISAFTDQSKITTPYYQETKIYNNNGNYIKTAYRNAYNTNGQLLSSKEITSDTGIDDEAIETYGMQTYNTYKNDVYSSLAKTQIKNASNTALVTTVYTTNTKGDLTKQEIFEGSGTGTAVESVEFTYDTDYNLSRKYNRNAATVLQEERYAYSDEYDNIYPTSVYSRGTNGAVIARTEYEYNFNKGLVSDEIDGLGNETEFYYDSLGRLTNKIYPDEADECYYYYRSVTPRKYEVVDETDYSLVYNLNSYGQVATVNDLFCDMVSSPTEDITYSDTLQTITYDNLDRPISVWNAGEGTTTISYDAFGRQISVQYPNYSQTLTAKPARVKYYDVFLEGSNKYSMVMTISPEDKISCEYYDVKGRLVKTAVVTNPSTLLARSDIDRLTQMPSNITLINTARYEYDDLNRVIKEYDGENRPTAYTYNAAGKVLTVSVGTAMDGFASINYTYDKAGRLITMTQGTHVTSYTYDLAGRLTQTTDPMGYYEQTTYDLAGNVLTARDKNGVVAYYYYDIRNRLTGITKGNLNTTYTYDDAGRVLTETNESGTITYRYRYDGLLEEKTMPDGKSISYTYNSEKQKTGYTDYFGNNTTYTYHNGKVKNISQNGNTTTNTYYRDGSVKEVLYPNGVNELYSYNYAGKLLMHQNSYDGYERLNELYTYDNSGNIVRKSEYIGDVHRVTTYVYDSCNRLIQENRNGTTDYYSYDQYGNREFAIAGDYDYQYTYDANNRILNEAKWGSNDGYIRYGYDNNGNLLYKDIYSSATDGDIDSYIEYDYDNFNRLIDFEGDNDWATYRYYADGMRAAKYQSGTTTKYYYDGQNVVNEIKNNANYATNLLGVTGYISRTQNGTIGYFERDGHGDIVSVYGANGTTQLANYTYDAFGNQKAKSGTWAETNPIRYCGEYYDTESGLIYLRARYYESESGRFLTEDPAKDGYNWYSYCAGNPVMFVDPSGLEDVIVKYVVEKNGGIVTYDAENNQATVTLNDITHTYDLFSDDVKNGRLVMDNDILAVDFGINSGKLLHEEGDKFDCADDAALAWSLRYLDISCSENKEYGSVIYSDYDDNNRLYYSFQNPQIGLPNTVNIEMFYRPSGTDYVTTIHSHPGAKGYKNEVFSDSDKRLTNRGYYGFSYVATPSGNLLKYYVGSGQTIKLCNIN